VLAELSAAGFPVPPGFVVTTPDEPALAADARRLGADRFAVRSSAAAEDLPDASYAGLYESYLNVPLDGLAEAVRACFAAAGAERVRAYHGGADPGMAVLIQPMVDAVAAGVAFTAHPVTGDRDRAVVTAVAGLADPLVSGETTGEEWTVGDSAVLTRPGPAGRVLTTAQAEAVAALARRVADRYRRPQDVEWAIDHAGRLWLLQARPMTALPEPVSWAPPGPGLWMRNFRLGEWLPEAVTPLFADWLLPLLEDGYLDGVERSVGVRVAFRYALVNGWYYTSTPIPSLRLLGHILRHGRVRVLYNALIRVNRDPAGADRAALSELHRQWREEQFPRYRRLVATASAEAGTAGPDRLVELIGQLGREAGTYLWYLAAVGGSAWKMEAALTRFTRRYLDVEPQALLSGLPGARPVAVPHAVQSVDWYHPVAGELGLPAGSADRHAELAARRVAAEEHCAAALAGRPRLLARFRELLDVNQRYAVLREEQARDFTLAWPVLRTCVRRLGGSDDVFFWSRAEIDAPPTREAVAERRAAWQRQRRLAAPLTLGRPARGIGDPIGHAVAQARGGRPPGPALLVGQPASAGRATGPVRIVDGPADFASFAAGDVLVARATAPAWTPLFARAAAVVTDGGTLAAHASLVAREYGIPAVVGTGDATRRLRPGQHVVVDGTAGTVLPSAGPVGFDDLGRPAEVV
jgi:phosphohistidine swiveling domain-containing protein